MTVLANHMQDYQDTGRSDFNKFMTILLVFVNVAFYCRLMMKSHEQVAFIRLRQMIYGKFVKLREFVDSNLEQSYE